MKRSYGGSVTGGTGDIKPNVLTATTGTAGAVDDYVVANIQLPVPRFGTQRGRATIFEILAVDWYLAPSDWQDITAVHFAYLTTNTDRVTNDATSAANLVQDLERPQTFAAVIRAQQTTTSGATSAVSPIHVNMTDDNGNGYLVAADRLQIVGGGIADTSTTSVYIAKIKYRMVNVGIEEYVGIVQSQQMQ